MAIERKNKAKLPPLVSMNAYTASHHWRRHYAALYCALALAGNAFAASTLPAPAQAKAASEAKTEASKNQTTPEQDKLGTKALPMVVEVANSSAIHVEATDKTAKRHDYASSEWWLVYLTGGLAAITFALALYTAKLYRATVKLGEDASATSKRQKGETDKAIGIAQQAANAAKDSADALVSASMPVLFPTVIDMAGLHPLISIQTPYTHDSNIFIKFENFGGTPATIREVRAKLYLTLKDVLPEPNPAEWIDLPYSVIIPGNSSAADQHFGALDMKQTIAYGQSEIAELHAEADPNGVFRRFVLMGMVTYDDFFGWRHVRTYCVKMRAWIPEEGSTLNQFQIGIGGASHNKWTKEKIPSQDPIEKTQI